MKLVATHKFEIDPPHGGCKRMNKMASIIGAKLETQVNRCQYDRWSTMGVQCMMLKMTDEGVSAVIGKQGMQRKQYQGICGKDYLQCTIAVAIIAPYIGDNQQGGW